MSEITNINNNKCTKIINLIIKWTKLYKLQAIKKLSNIINYYY